MTETNLIPPSPQLHVVEPVPPKTRFPVILVSLVIFLLIGGAAFATYLYQQNQILRDQLAAQTPTSTVSITPTTVATSTVVSSTVTPVAAGENTRFGQITWFDIPKTIVSPNIFKIGGTGFYSDKANQGNYFQVASFSDGSKLILAQLPSEGPSSSFSLLRIVQSPNGQFFYLTSHIDTWLLESLRPNFVSMSSSDLTLNGLATPDVITSSNQYYHLQYPTGDLFGKLSYPKKLFDTVNGPVYEVVKEKIVSELPDFYGKQFYLKLKDSTIVSYNFSNSPELSKNNSSPEITWSDSTKNSSSFHQNLVVSCASGGVGIPFLKSDSTIFTSKVQVGQTDKGKPVYQIMDPNSVLVKHLYNNYKQGRDYPSAPPIISLADFAAKHNHYFWQDSMGDWQIFLNQDFSMMAECGKPVIYLYPQKDTQVTVKVSADITKSDPLYPNNGWTVLAHPNGQLDYQGKVYPNLFWEGLGQGIYPDIRNIGFVVSQKKLIPTIKSQLSKQGLNSQEIFDFMEFWTSKLPSTPFVRLTWLDTADMNRLAPLQVSPMPKTVIRIFLDFAGLEKPITLIPQKLITPVRDGFTLVEWGGLLVK